MFHTFTTVSRPLSIKSIVQIGLFLPIGVVLQRPSWSIVPLSVLGGIRCCSVKLVVATKWEHATSPLIASPSSVLVILSRTGQVHYLFVLVTFSDTVRIHYLSNLIILSRIGRTRGSQFGHFVALLTGSTSFPGWLTLSELLNFLFYPIWSLHTSYPFTFAPN